jgi:hypothetical protein
VWIPQKLCEDTSYRTCVFATGAIYGHVVLLVCLGTQNIHALFVMLGWARCGAHKKRIRTRHAKLVFLHPCRSAGHVVRSSASRAQNIDALFSSLGGLDVGPTKSVLGHVTLNLYFCIQCDLRGTWCILVHLRREMLTHYFHVRMGLMRIPKKHVRETSHRTCTFAYNAIYGSHNPYWCFRGYEMLVHYFSWSGGPGADPIKSTPHEVWYHGYHVS